ncbi:MAG: DUF4175 family protein, partial [Pseudomonadota bacterium]
FALAFMGALVWSLKGFRPPTTAAADRRLETDGGLAHRPFAALADAPATPLDEDAAALWRAHQDQARQAADTARVRRPSPGLHRRDPYALRLAVLFAVLSGLALAGRDAPMRLAAGFAPQMGPAGARVQLDAWITPPAYTGAAPILMSGPRGASGPDAALEAPAGSILSIRLAGGRGAAELSLRGDRLAGSVLRLEAAEEGGRTIDVDLTESVTAHLRQGRFSQRWRIDVAPDAAPQATFSADPETDERSRVTLAFAVADDYGVAKAELRMRLAPDQVMPEDAPPLSPEALSQTRAEAVPLSPARPRSGEQTASLDLTAHPWAGLDVDLTIAVVDEAGQWGSSAPRRVKLPERDFFAPMAQAVVEQRRTLTVAPRHWPNAVQAFEAMTLGPELFYETARDYLLVRTAYWRLLYSEGENLEAMADRLWDLALRLEDGDLSLARRALEAAMEALRAALERDAPADEIASLTDDVRMALERYLAALTADALSRGE